MDYKQKQTCETSTQVSAVARDQPIIMSSNQQFAHFDSPDNCYGLQNEQSFPEFAAGLDPGSRHAYPTDKGQSNSEMNWGNHVNPTSVNSTTMGCDPRAMLSNLSFLEQKIHQVQDIVRSIMNQEGQICNQPNELAAQQQLATADLTLIIIQLISTAGTLLPSINGTLLSTNSSVEQLGSIIGSSTSLVGLNVNMDQSVVFTSEEAKTPEHEGQIKGTSKNCVEERSPVEEQDGKDLEDGGEIENLPPGSYEVLQLEKEEILAPHTHFCTICGKGFKRDANLRMHMRGHGDEYKTAAALAKPSKDHNSEPVLIKRYSCPFVGCKRNKEHKKFQPLKTILCVKNHYKRSHCDKRYVCSRCNSKKFSVIADLKTHEKHCGRDKWICSCGTTFSRKDKLFGHVSLFQGHAPALPLEETKMPGTSDQGQINGAMTNMGDTELSFSGSGGDDIDGLDIKVLDNDANFFSPVSFDSYNLGGLNDFPRPAYEVSESSFSFFPSMSSNYVRKSGENLNSRHMDPISDGGPERDPASEMERIVPLALALPPPTLLSEDLRLAMDQVEDAYKGKESVTGDNGCLSKGEVKDILTKVENFMETQACDTAKMLGVSYNGVDKGLKNSMLLIKRRWMADMARKAKADVGGKLNSEES